jgi:sugar-specific transcriptional regulator TrmB
MKNTDALEVVQKYLQVFDIDHEATAVYLSLSSQGPVSALQVSKATSISRTQVYRRLEELQAKGLVSAEQLSYGTLFRSLPFENVEALIAQRETENKAARDDLGSMIDLMQTMAGNAGPKARVQHYYGLAGIKQVNWNLLRADGKYWVFEAAHLSQHLDKTFARRHRERCIELGLISHDLTNDTVALAKDLEPINRSRAFIRHIDKEILTIRFEVVLYNDVVALLDYSDGQQLAMEIYHPTLHAMMRQLFDAMWNIADPLEIR